MFTASTRQYYYISVAPFFQWSDRNIFKNYRGLYIKLKTFIFVIAYRPRSLRYEGIVGGMYTTK